MDTGLEHKVLNYIKDVLEVPREEYNGMSACPFAKKERETDNIYLDSITTKNDFIVCMHKFVKSGKNSAVLIQEHAEFSERDTKRYQHFLNQVLEVSDLGKWKALCINPNDELDKKDIYYAHKSMKNTKYYDKMDGKYKKYLGL